jgi:predicted DNA-binding protein (MmcQ/YjbR family)
MNPDPIHSLRELCMALPEVTERLSHGEPTWFVRDKKVFVMLSNHHHDDRLGFWCAAPTGAQEMLVECAPERYFRPPYVGRRGWLGVYLDVPVDWDEIADLVTDAYCLIAPAKLAEQARDIASQQQSRARQ